MMIYWKGRRYLITFAVVITSAVHSSALKASMTACQSAVASAGSGGDGWKASGKNIASSAKSSLTAVAMESKTDVVTSREALVRAANDVCER